MTAIRSGFVSSLALVCLVGTGRAQGILDQYTPCNTGGALQIQSHEVVGQAFVPAAPNLIGVELFLERFNAPFADTLTLKVVEGTVSGPLVATASRALAYPADAAGWYRFDFGTAVPVAAGLTHSILLDATNPSWGWRLEYATPGCGYPDGAEIVTGIPYPGSALTFRTYTMCGNALPDAGEECDDGNADSTDGCTTGCSVCGNGVRTAPEECDDGNTVDGDGCEGDCTLPSCGDGAVQVYEECDDGNPENADCCTRGCRIVPAGRGCVGDLNACTDDVCDGAGGCTHVPNAAPCDDGIGCNGPDTCGGGSCSRHTGNPCPQCRRICAENFGQPFCIEEPDDTPCGANSCAAGACAGGVCNLGTASTCDPCLACDGAGGCIPPTAPGCWPADTRSSSVTLTDAVDSTRDVVNWAWKVDGGMTKADFGASLTWTSETLCVFDATGLKLSATVPAGGVCAGNACWRDLPTGVIYRDRELTPHGISKLTAKVGRTGQGKLRVRGRGTNLLMPALDLATPVTVRLVRGDGTGCFEATYATPIRNDAQQFRARND